VPYCRCACAQDPLRALIFDSYYDPYRGVVCQFRVVDGKVKKGDTVVMMNTGKEYTLDEIGVLAPVKTPVSHALGVLGGKVQVGGGSFSRGGVGWEGNQGGGLQRCQ
jgi:GTP-binding protein LepA